MKKALKITGILVLVFTLVANLQYAMMGYDVTNNPNLIRAESPPPSTTTPVTIQAYCPPENPGLHGEYYWTQSGSSWYEYGSCNNAWPNTKIKYTKAAYTTRFSVSPTGSRCGPYEGYTTGYATYTQATNVIGCWDN